MKTLSGFILMGGLMIAGMPASAQNAADVEQLRKQLQQMQENFERTQQTQREQIEALQKQLNAVQEQQASNAVATAEPVVAAPADTAWKPSEPLRVGGGGTYADVSMVGTFAAGTSTAKDIEGGTELGGHDPNQRGITVQGVEMNLQGAVDPYFRGNANLAYQIDSGGESHVELEEGWLETVSLPANLQIRAGQYLTEFGRINTQHPHMWGFVDAPLVSGRFLGEDGLRNPGARLSWLVPTAFYSELFFGVQDSQGSTAASFRDTHDNEPYLGRLWGTGDVKTAGDLLYSARYALSLDLSDTQTLLGGLSAAFGPNSSGPDKNSQIYGADLYWKWKPDDAHGGFPFISFQSEAMLRRVSAGAFSNDLNGNSTLDAGEDVFGDGLIHTVGAETLTDWGCYAQVLWGFQKSWVAGLRGDYVGRVDAANYEVTYGDDPNRLGRWRISPNLTWYPSEFSKLRLQYNYDDRQGIGSDHSIWLQFEFLLGAHAAHKF